MLAHGVEANVVSYCALIQACVKEGDVERAELWFHRMQDRGITANVVSYSGLINVCAKAGDAVRAEKWLGEMSAAGIQPNAVCYNNVIDACSRAGDGPRAEAWLRRLCELWRAGPGRSALKPTRQSFTAAAQAFSVKGAWQDAERIFDGMRDIGLDMDEFSLTVLLSAYWRGRPRQPVRAEAAFRRHVVDGLPVTRPALRVLRSALGVQRYGEVLAELGLAEHQCGSVGADRE
jgi:pentatricopeptide repeat domain-containing protein 1